MTIELTDGSVNRVGYVGTDDIDLAAGKTLKIETSPDGGELLNATVPDGKVWRVQINMEITETDA